METTTLYKKVGKKYVKHDDYGHEGGLPCGLYLFYKPKYNGEHSAMMNMMHYAKVHNIIDVATFSDIYVNIADDMASCIGDAQKQVMAEMKNTGFSFYDIAVRACKLLAEKHVERIKK
jgi:molybdopterin biosynthesis enzyme MoaB